MKHPYKKKWGQNFIHDQNTINKIIKIINPIKNEEIIEIGPGLGSMTIPLALKVKKITAIEIDPLCVNALNKKNIKNLEIINADILKINFSNYSNSSTVIGNLPYNISSPILFHTMEQKNINKMVFMLQKELVERINSVPHKKIYGRISVMLQTYFKIKYHFPISKSVFQPVPKVDSAIISLNRKPNPIQFPKIYSEIIKRAFQNRRKKLKNNLDFLHIDSELKKFSNLRAEDLNYNDYIKIYDKYVLNKKISMVK